MELSRFFEGMACSKWAPLKRIILSALSTRHGS
jgi:hypothetical protein